MPSQQVAVHSTSLSRLSKHGRDAFHKTFFVLFCFCISKSVANVLFLQTPRRERGQGREPDRCHPDANEGLEMPAGGSMFDILHHSQLVFSAEMSDQLTALPLTFNRKTQQMQVGLTEPGPTDRRAVTISASLLL